MDNIKDVEKIDMDNVDRGLKAVKVRDIIAKLVDDSKYHIDLDDEEVNDLIEDLMSEDLTDKEGNKHQSSGISSGDTVVRILDNHFERFTEAMKNVSPEKLQEVKEQIRNAIQENPFLGDSLDVIGIDINNFENYLGRVEVLTIERRRIFNIYEIKKE
jgi:transcription antitermination factor NusG